MGFLKNIFQKRSNNLVIPPFIIKNINGFDVDKNPIALSCEDIIATSISSLPFDLYRKTDKGREKVKNHPLAEVLKLPNYDEPKSLFFNLIVKDYFRGNIYLYKYYGDDGQIYSLFRLDPSKVKVIREKGTNQKLFLYDDKTYNHTNILHIPSRYGYDGLTGKSIYNYFSNAFELANKLDTYFNASFSNGFGNGKRPILDLSEIIDKSLEKVEIDEIKQKFLDDYTGYINTEKPIIKTVKNVKYETIDVGSTSNKEQQLAENITIGQELICKVYNVPSSFLKGKNEYNGLESLYQILLDFAVRPIVENLIDGFSMILTPMEREYLYIEPNYNALMRMNYGDKIEAYNKQLGNGSLTINEVRAMENKPSLGPAGDIPNIPANLIPLTEEVVNARLATQKLALVELQKTDNNIEKTGEY